MTLSIDSIAILSAIAIIIIAFVIKFILSTKEQKLNNVKEWLKYAVAAVEKGLGSGTGKLKLRTVYDMAVAQFPWLIKAISFDTFSSWVDEALDWLKEQIEQNKNIEHFVKNN